MIFIGRVIDLPCVQLYTNCLFETKIQIFGGEVLNYLVFSFIRTGYLKQECRQYFERVLELSCVQLYKNWLFETKIQIFWGGGGGEGGNYCIILCSAS